MGNVYSTFLLVSIVCADIKSLRIISHWLQLLRAAAFMSPLSLYNEKSDTTVCMQMAGTSR